MPLIHFIWVLFSRSILRPFRAYRGKGWSLRLRPVGATIFGRKRSLPGPWWVTTFQALRAFFSVSC